MALSVGQSSKAFSMVSARRSRGLVPVLGSGVSPGHSVLRFSGEEGVGDAQTMESAEFK